MMWGGRVAETHMPCLIEHRVVVEAIQNFAQQRACVILQFGHANAERVIELL